MATFTHANTKTWSRIQFTMIQIRLLLRTTTSISEEKLSAIRVGIERRWIRDVNIFAIDKNNFCKAQLVIRIDWDSYDVRRFVEKSFVFLGDKESTDDTIYEMYLEFLTHYSKDISNNLLTMQRFTIFKQNVKSIIAHNSDKSSTWEMGVNEWTDLTDDEFHTVFPLLPRDQQCSATNRQSFALTAEENLPKFKDWRDAGVVPAVNN